MLTENRAASIKNIRISSKTLQEMIVDHQRRQQADHPDFLSKPADKLDSLIYSGAEENGIRSTKNRNNNNNKNNNNPNSRDHTIKSPSKRASSINSDEEEKLKQASDTNSVVVGITLFVVLSIHSFFEGTAIGVQVCLFTSC